MTAANILQSALGHMQDRAATYDKPDGERSMGATVDAFKAVTGVLMTEEQGWLFMALLKAVRSQQGAYRADSYEDGAAYFALAGESAAKERNGGWDAEAIKAAALPASFGQQNMMAGDRVTISGLREWIDPADVEIGDTQSFADSLEAFKVKARASIEDAYQEEIARQIELHKPAFKEFLKTIPVDTRAEPEIGEEAGDNWYSKAELIQAINAASVEPASLIDDESPRAQVVQQNGEMAAEVYAAVDAVDPWAGAPEWAKYKAQDESGDWWWFELAPIEDDNYWENRGEESRFSDASTSEPNPDWRTTLISR